MVLDWLWIGDTHAPYSHKDSLSFLRHIKKTYCNKSTKFGHVGDECDAHTWSFHKSDPDLMNPSAEFNAAFDWIQELAELFPKLTLLESNHGSLHVRRQKDAYLPRQILKSYNEMWDVPDTWRWHYEFTFKLSTGAYCYAHHGKSSNVLRLSQSMGMCALQGHYHEKMGVAYWANPHDLYWGAQSGCLIDDKSLAFAYNNTNLKRPLLGSLGIVNGKAISIPMVLNKRGRWVGRLI